MRGWVLPAAVLLAAGCQRAAAPVFQPGDDVRPEIAFAPTGPWPIGATVAVGMLVRLERPGAEGRYLHDDEVPLDRAVMSARVSFWDADRPVGEPLDVPLVRDC